uniref:Uncharacterized protein n=1 Tax=Triticum urartu TaxID=4572 RepID=A0A8R7TIE8_TRIUA
MDRGHTLRAQLQSVAWENICLRPPLPLGLRLIWFWSRGSPPVSCLILFSPPPILSPTRFEQTLGFPPALSRWVSRRAERDPIPPSPTPTTTSRRPPDRNEEGEEEERMLIARCLCASSSWGPAAPTTVSGLSSPSTSHAPPPRTASYLTSLSTSRSRRWACWQGVSAFPSSRCASARLTATVPSSAQQPSGHG